MNTIGVLRTVVNMLLTTAESRILGVLGATDLAVSAFIIAVTNVVQTMVTAAFNLVETIITEAFTVVGSVVDAALGETQGEDN